MRKVTFKPVTSYFYDHYRPHKSFTNGNKLMTYNHEYAYLNIKTREYAKLPHWLSETLEGRDKITYVIGPWIFVNGFEDTEEGKYLIKIFPHYFNMSERTKQKVEGILNTYSYWARIHKEYVCALS